MAAIDDSGKVSTTIVAGSGKGVDSRLASYASAYDNAVMNTRKAKVMVKGMEEMLKALEGVLVKTPIRQWEIVGGKTRLYFDTVNNFPHNNNRTLNAHHYLEGLPAWKGVGQNGLADSDFTEASVSTGWNVVQYDQARTDTNAIKVAPKGANVRSCGLGKNNKRISLTTAGYAPYFTKASNGTMNGTTIFTEAYAIVASNTAAYQANGTESNDHGLLSDLSKGTEGLSNMNNVEVWYWFRGQYRWFKNKWLPKKIAAEADKKKKYQDAAKALKLPDPFGATDQKKTTTGTGTKPKDTDNKGDTQASDDTKSVIYNLPGMSESYFTPNNAAMFVSEGDTPSKVADATRLWQDVGAHKGMIQSYLVPKKLGKNTNWFKPENIKGTDDNTRIINDRRYGFQFLYNPSTVSMEYAGAPQVDIGLEISGQDKVPLIGAGVSSSTISFQLLLNRMTDMRRLGRIDTVDAQGNTTTKVDWENAQNYYSWMVGPKDTDAGRYPEAELTAIAEMGTMYDVEYLLTTLLGYKLKSEMRGNRFTADIGYLGAYPVELHLGKNLRYLVTIDSFSLNHTIFTKDMVPVFTNLGITCNRLPDFGKKMYNDVKPPTTAKTT